MKTKNTNSRRVNTFCNLSEITSFRKINLYSYLVVYTEVNFRIKLEVVPNIRRRGKDIYT